MYISGISLPPRYTDVQLLIDIFFRNMFLIKDIDLKMNHSLPPFEPFFLPSFFLLNRKKEKGQ